MWRGESGQAFDLPTLISQSSDFVAPLSGLAGFSSSTVRYGGYSQTIFRLPLRTQASGLSDNTYNTKKLLELLDALREEAKYLLLFLKSVCKIEVIRVSPQGQHSTSFSVEIAPASLAAVSAKRDSFMQQLRQAHDRQKYQITNVISFTANFSVVVTDYNPSRNQAGTSNWLIANCVGSAEPTVQEAAAKQHTFPWVGAVLELGGSSAVGRIFCFLPMPVETSSGLPIHVNGTFGLNDERRTLKWPGIERRNDPTTNWNKTLVSQLLPSCYAMLLTEAKNHLSPDQFYNAWPDVTVVRNTQFSEILQPLFTALFRQAVIWMQRTEGLQDGNWILISQATFISQGTSLLPIVKRVLSSCGVQLATIPAIIWGAIQFARLAITEVSPQLARSSLRSYPHSYSSIDQYGRRELLTYCLSDNCYSDLSGLNLLPLSNGTFTNFDNYYRVEIVYLCSTDCPRSLLPNLDHLLVDLSDNSALQMSLYQVAISQQTRLRVLTEREVANHLTQAMPLNWKSGSLISSPHSQQLTTWLQTFWNWVKNKQLNLFSNQLLIPCYGATSHSSRSFYLMSLSTAQPVVYVSKHTACSESLLSALYKMNVRVCLQSEFSFVQHNHLTRYIKCLDTNNALDAIASKRSYVGTSFTAKEADSLRSFLYSGSYTPSNSRKDVLQNLTIFSSASNSHSQLYSVSSAASQSVSKQALGEPSNCAISLSNLPPNVILFSRGDYHQLQLLQALNITFPTDYTLLVSYIFPLINRRTFPDNLIDKLMTEVLDTFQVLNLRERRSNFSSSLQSLSFVKTVCGRKTPAELFNPLNADITALYSGEDVFPLAPYNTPQRVQVLMYCGLRTSVTPQQVLDIIYSISSPTSSYPQRVNSTQLNRAKAVLEYISTQSFQGQTGGYHYTVPNIWRNCSFSNALTQLSTSRSWLPVRSDRPSDYCSELSWKGNGYSSHFISLSSSVAVLTSSTAHTLPHLVGSQMYLVSPTVSSQVATMLSTDSNSIAQHVVAHFKEIIAPKNQLSAKWMDYLVHKVYSFMNSEGASCLYQVYSISKWIYLKKENKLLAPASVALRQHPTFRQDLEPYVYILPDSLSKYTTLFGQASKVVRNVTRDQILSILKSIRDQRATRRTSDQEAWRIVMSILNWLTNNGTESISDDISVTDILVPIESQSQWPQLVQASEVTYTDNEFLKEYITESEEKDSHMFVHPRISAQLAHLLGVMPLSEQLDISEDTFEDAGQHEPLTTRLKNILRDYKDGLTIIKELLQNADDAEATEVNICYDARQHETDSKKLFFSGMAEAHGPALIVHNNKTFSDDDFKNITKLAAATKQGKALKIGKFGVGFCSVYHMTDVPSFISRDYFYIFDPTLSHLRKEVKNSAQPGKKTKFTHKLISRSRQLDPYNELFGFDRTKSYYGTMFRLPFRTHASELSGTLYSEATVQELISAIKESSTNLLLFLQHVRTITFQRIEAGQSTPTVLLKINRETVPLPLSTSSSSGIEVRNLSCTDYKLSESCQWLVSQKSESSYQREYYTASVACPLGFSSYKVNPDFEGEIFCFLPLAQKTGLPVHVSSNFAVINNRRGIWTSDEAASKADREVKWNMTLMQGVIASAYHALLIALKELSQNGYLTDYTFHNLWPKLDKLLQQNPWIYMLKQLYNLIGSDQLFYSAYRKQWLYLTESKFLKPRILCQSSDQSSTPTCVFDVLMHLNIPMVNLPVNYHKYFNLKTVMIDESAFVELFFSNLESLASILNTRSEVIQHMLEVYAAEYDDGTARSYSLHNYFNKYACIPCTPDGRTLKKCTDVVDPRAEFAPLFDKSEGCFPIEQLSSRHLSGTALIELGMISQTIPYDMLVERAQTIASLYKTDKTKALERVKLILSSCDKLEKNEPQHAKKGTTCKQKQPKQLTTHRVELCSVPFLPVLPRPEGYHLAWKGDGCDLMCGKDLMIVGIGRYRESINPDLAGSQVAIVNEKSTKEGGCGYIVQDTIGLLKIRRSPSVEEVVAHLAVVQQTFQSQPATEKLVLITDRMCRQVYGFLDGKLEPEGVTYYTGVSKVSQGPDPRIVQSLQSISCVWTGKQFVEGELIAKESWNNSGPYLYNLPASLSSRKNLIKVLKIKKQFEFVDIKTALNKMKRDFEDKPVDERCQNILKDIISLLQKLKFNPSETYLLMLPDEKYILHLSNKLAYNDVDWAPRDPEHTYVHEIVPPHLANKLSVQPARSKILEKFISSSSPFQSIEFGQREELTDRIQNILRDYPFDITILKELLQNADDAKATKMYFILDKRTHGTQGILSKNWGKLQGPALLVWNDSVFSEKDLIGIQQLGLGSKRSDSETIGQYGIGFNVVYHLTDCPSFITGGETMCVLDPQCEYVHEANVLFPGRRFDGLSTGFWECFPDMSSAYLQTELKNCPPELRGGSLFRFPLRTTKDHLDNSKIIQRNKEGKPITECITSNSMFRMLSSWAPKMKDAMLFLNHIKELQFIVIEEKSKNLEIKNKFCREVDDSALHGLQEALSSFKNKQGNKSVVTRYPLTIRDIYCSSSGKESSAEEKWLIQQGVGDIDNEDQTWSFIDTVKPRHGIAAPIPTPQRPYVTESILTRTGTFSQEEKFLGCLFCFLPLPVSSNLPVHINGNFILNSNRRNLWVSTEAKREDDRSAWNSRLFQAIASSYVNLLEHARIFYVSSEQLYKTEGAVNNDIRHFYDIFPQTEDLEKRYKALAESVYEKLVQKNVSILAVVSSKTSNHHAITSSAHEESEKSLKVVSWYPPKSENPSSQVYFWSCLETLEKNLKHVLEDLGMKLTAAENFLQDHLNNAIKDGNQKIPTTSPDTVFEYYCKFCAQASHSGRFPCAINESVLKNVATFKMFTEYLLRKSLNIVPLGAFGIPKELTFPKEPFGHPLLLTADNQLRRFQENAKILKSNFSHLFPNCLEYFLHPDLTKLCYKSTYFVTYSDPPDNSYSLSLVNKLLSMHLPSSLRTKRLPLFPSGLSRDMLRGYWKCFKGDSVFCSNLPELLKEWALLPSDSGSLHSSSDSLVPVVPQIKVESSTENVHDRIYQVLQQIGMPFLNIATTVYIPYSCPKISDVPAILKALFHLNQEKDLSSILGKRVKTIISYLNQIDFRHKEDSLKHVKSLPLFECIDGRHRAVVGKTVYVWPNDAPTVGFSVWSKGVPNVLFLKDNAYWVNISTLEVLGINTLTAEKLYWEYIFLHFSTLSETDRYEHLTHIRDTLFQRNIMYRDSKSKYAAENRQIAATFLSALRRLQCIGENNLSLRLISDFCNHEVEIFTTFSKHFQFLPKFFKDSWKEWLDFFKELGLKHTVNQEEFIQFCQETAKGEHPDPVKASSVLLKHLCSENAKEAGWHTNNLFLSRVGDIPFVPVQSLPELTWIKSAQCGSTNLVAKGQQVSLTKLNEAAIPECAVHVWTVKPVIKLPSSFYPDLIGEHGQLAQRLGITCKATVADVIQNIRNITATKRFTDFQHFDQYPESNKPPANIQVKSLMTVMGENLKFLESNQSLSDAQAQLLRDTPCIPVYSTFDKTHSWQIVLVEPCCVLRYGAIVTYHPFLHCLDSQLSRLTYLLQQLGIESAVGFSHVQYVLKKAHVSSAGQEMNPKTRKCVFAILQKLIDLCYSSHHSVAIPGTFEERGKTLSPLYLPNRNDKLALSTTLLYVDDDNFKGRLSPRLEGTGYSMLKVRSSESGILLFEKDFCELLPKEVRPIGLSTLCSQTVLPGCKPSRSHSDIGATLEETFEMKATLANAVSACVNYYTKARPPLDTITAIALEFFNCTKIQTLHHLRLSINFKQTDQMLGNLDTKYYLAIPDDSPNGCLYLDSRLTTKSHLCMKVIDALSNRLMKLVRTRITKPELITGSVHEILLKVFGELLRAQNPQIVREILEYRNISLEEEEIDDVTFKLGREVPECWHHRLDQTVENVFHPDEIVGYEIMEGVIVYARIMHPILPEGVESFSNIPRVNMSYMILTSPDDEEGSPVSVLELFKFLTGLKRERPSDEGETGLVRYEGETETVQIQQELRRERLQEICSDLSRQLDEIWKLPEEDRKKALRRLCLKWHPDKNLDNQQLAEAVFKFLNNEISKRAERSDFIHWEELQRTARRQRDYYQREQSAPRSRGGGEGGFGGTGWGGASAEVPTFDETSIRPERDLNEGRRWLEQAQANFSTLLLIHLGSHNNPKVCGNVCFMAHQVAETALKGGKYFVCGLDANSLVSHNLSTHAYGLQSERPGETHGLAAHTTPLETYYLDPRYPNRWPPGIVPADRYTYQQAEDAKDHAQAILDIITNIIENEYEP